MGGNERKRQRLLPAVSTFSYAQVETALAKVYAAEHVQQTAFRGRLKHFRKLGIPSLQPGKGKRIRYTKTDIFQLMLSCELAEFGIDPYLIADIVQRHWRMKGSLFQAINYSQNFPGNDFHVAIDAHFMSWAWNREKITHTATEISVSVKAEPVTIHVFKASDSEVLFTELQKAGQRSCVFNLSARMRAVEQALAE